MNRFKIENSFPVEPDMFVEVAEAGHRLVVHSVEFIREAGGRELVGLPVTNAAPDYLSGLGVGWTAELR